MASEIKTQIALCSDEDIPTCFQVLSKSFGHEAPFIDIYYPQHTTESGQRQACKRLIKQKHSSDDIFFLKATTRDDHDGKEQIIGFAIWTHMRDPPPADLAEIENLEEVWPDKNDREFMTRVWAEFVMPRSDAIKQASPSGLFVLEMLLVDPDYRGHGAGSALVRWGTAAADAQGVESIVEATPKGMKTYEKCGFRTEIERMRFDVGEKLRDRRVPVLLFLRRRIGP